MWGGSTAFQVECLQMFNHQGALKMSCCHVSGITGVRLWRLQSGWLQEIMCDVRELETDEYSLNLLCIVSLNISIS